MIQQAFDPPPKSPDNHKINILWFVGYVVMYIVTCVLHAVVGYWGNVLFFPMVFVTTLAMYLVFNSLVRKGSVNTQLTLKTDLFRVYSHSFFGGGIFAFVVEMTIQFTFLGGILLLFGKSRLTTAMQNEDFGCNLRSNAAVHSYLLFTSFFVAGLTEEFLKGFLLQYLIKLYVPHPLYLNSSYIKTFIWFGLMIGLGFGTIEGVLYVCFAGGYAGFLAQFIIWLVRALIAIPFHSILGLLWGINLSKRDINKQNINWFHIGYQQVFLHGLYDFIEFEITILISCESSVTSVIVGLLIAVIFTVLSLLFALYKYKKLIKIADAELIPDNEYQHHDVNDDIDQ